MIDETTIRPEHLPESRQQFGKIPLPRTQVAQEFPFRHFRGQPEFFVEGWIGSQDAQLPIEHQQWNNEQSHTMASA